MARAIHAKRFVMIFGLLTLFFITGMTSTAVAQLSQEEPEPLMTVPEYVMKCYDGKGFAAEPGGVSDLETTLDAAKLLMDQPDSWPVGMGRAIDSIVERYAGMQYLTRGGFVAEGEDGPDFRTTAIIIETLDVLGRLDAIHVGMVESYLDSSFRGSLTLKKWLTDGDFDTKYWALRTASTLDCVHRLGLYDVSLHKVISPDANRAEFPEVEPYLVWNQPLFEQGSRYGSPFNDMDYEKQLDVVESLDMIIGNSTYNPTIMPMLVDVDAFTTKVSQRFDRDSGFFLNEEGDADLEVTRKAIRALNRTGTLQNLFSDGMGARRLVKTRKNVDTLMDAWTIDGMSEIARTTDLINMKEIKAGLENVDKPVHVFTPQFEDVDGEGDTGIASWDEDEIQKVYVPDALIESLNSEDSVEKSQDSHIGSIIVLVTLISLTVVTAGAGKKKLALILSLLCVLLFMGQYAYGIDAVTRDAARFLGSIMQNSTNQGMMGNLGMLRIGTRYVDLPVSDGVDEIEESGDVPSQPVGSASESGVLNHFSMDSLDFEEELKYPEFAKLLAESMDPNADIEIELRNEIVKGEVQTQLTQFATAFAEASGINDAIGVGRKVKAAIDTKVQEWLERGYIGSREQLVAILNHALENDGLILGDGEEVVHIAVSLDDDVSNTYVVLERDNEGRISTEVPYENYRVAVLHPKKSIEKTEQTLKNLKRIEEWEEQTNNRIGDISLQDANIRDIALELRRLSDFDKVSRTLQVRNMMEPGGARLAPFAVDSLVYDEKGNIIEGRTSESRDFMRCVDNTEMYFDGPFTANGEITTLQMSGMSFYSRYADMWNLLTCCVIP